MSLEHSTLKLGGPQHNSRLSPSKDSPLICAFLLDVPRFGEPIINVTAPVGREATLVCVVDDLGSYKVNAFL